MPTYLFARLTFLLERMLQRGAFFQLLVMAALIVGVASLGGLLAWLLTPDFAHLGSAIWWAFLRLTDPGYLGDDEGLTLRIISTTVTVLGYVLFMGSLIAILTQALDEAMERLESGLTPIAMRDHILILGWTNRTPPIVRELMLSQGRVRRFLRHRGARNLRIVILADKVDARLRAELRDYLGAAWKDHHIIFRSGSSLRTEHLRRVDLARASVVILPGADFTQGGASTNDARIIKTLLSIATHPSGGIAPPPVIAEVFDADKVAIAERAHSGELHVVSGDAFISRLIAQTIRHPGLSYLYGEILAHTSGNEIYVRNFPELAGQPFHSLAVRFPKAILLGVARQTDDGDVEPILIPPPNFTLEASDRLVQIARGFDDAAYAQDVAPELLPIRPPRPIGVQPHRRLLVLGWSHKVLALLRELGSYEQESFDLTLFSVVPIPEREEALERFSSPRVTLTHIVGDFTLEGDLRAVTPNSFDNIILLGSDWLRSDEESDARTLLGYVLLRSILGDIEQPEVIVELMDPENARLFRQRMGEVIISPVVLSHLLAHVALRRELHAVFGELFGPEGAEIFFRDMATLGLPGQTADFTAIRQAAAAHGEIALGVRLHHERRRLGGGVYLNPPRDTPWTISPGDEVIVLSTYDVS